MKYILLCIPLLLFTSCTMNGTDTRDTRITELEKQVQELKRENANIRENQALIDAWWIPTEIQPTPAPSGSTDIDNSMFPEWTTFEEANNAECLKQAQESFIASGNRACSSAWYTEDDIQSGKCKLTKEVIIALTTKRTNAESLCSP